MAEKVTIMVLKVVDLQCSCCYKKIKKILCKFPQIRDQVYDEKANTVTITVVCCDPEKIRDKLCCKGGKVIKSIGIKEPPPPPPKPTEPEKPKVVVVEKPKEPIKPKEPKKPVVVVVEKPKEPEKPKVIVVEKPKEPEKPEKPKVVVVEQPKPSGPPPVEKPREAPKPDPPKIPQPVPNPPREPEPVTLPPLYPVPTCCGQCYGGYDGGPCHLGYGVPPPPQPRFEGYYGYGCGYGCGYGYGRDCHHFSRCDHYLSEENPSSCSIM